MSGRLSQAAVLLDKLTNRKLELGLMARNTNPTNPTDPMPLMTQAKMDRT